MAIHSSTVHPLHERSSQYLEHLFHATELPHEIQHDEIQYKTISIAFIIIIKGRNQLLEDYTEQQHLT
jgi:hypothetical protein